VIAPTTAVSNLLRQLVYTRALLRELEAAEHPDITDRFGRVWTWRDEDIYAHDVMAWSLDSITHPDVRLPPAELASNPNYASLCAVCTSAWPVPHHHERNSL
jgi:hypothetical protein